MTHNSVIKKAQAGNFILARDFSPNGARGHVLTRIANATPGQPDDIDWRPGMTLSRSWQRDHRVVVRDPWGHLW